MSNRAALTTAYSPPIKSTVQAAVGATISTAYKTANYTAFTVPFQFAVLYPIFNS